MGIQVFVVAVELPKYYASRHWKSVVMMLGPVMTFGWLICALFAYLIFQVDFPTALVIAACLTPTDPVLAASILSNSQFSDRVPKRIKDLLSAESGCNDGISFPFLYIGLFLVIEATVDTAIRDWFTITVLWQCVFGTVLGLIIGVLANKVLRFSTDNKYIDGPGFTVFYLLLAILSIGIGSTLGADDFLVAFGCGYGFSRDGWFAKLTEEEGLNDILDLLLNSAMFVYLGTIIPWYDFEPHSITPEITPVRLVAFVVLVLLFRRIPIVMAIYKWIPDIYTFREALFCGHFGPMGLGGVFLAIEARAMLENGSASPEPFPPKYGVPFTPQERAVRLVWPIVCFVVLGSTLVHGLSVLAMSIASHFMRPKEQRAGVFAAETDPLGGMEHEGGDGDSIISDDDEEETPTRYAGRGRR